MDTINCEDCMHYNFDCLWCELQDAGMLPEETCDQAEQVTKG